MDFFINSAYAQADAGAQQSPLPTFIFLIGFILIFYLMIWRPQAKRAKEHRTLIASIAKGDEVMSSGGLLGKITHVDDNYVGIQVTDNVELKMQKSAIAAVLPKGTIKSI